MDYRSELSWALILLISLTLFLAGLGSYPLLDPDEGRNAQVALETVKEGHWLPPTLEGRVRYQKPPLYYWMVATSFLVLGPRETSARLPSALAALMGIMLTYLLGNSLWGKEKGLLAALVTATTLIYVVYSHIVIFDMVLTAFILASLFFSWKGLEEENRKAWISASLFIALAFLTKGPVGIIIPFMALIPLIIYKLAIDKERISIPILAPLMTFLIVAVPPFLLAEVKSPGYCYHFFWLENVVRYLRPVFHREAPFYFYLVVIILGFLPWTVLLPRIFKRLGGLWSLYPHRTVFLVSWILLPTLFFTLAKSKMPHYILPTFPAWALLLAGAWKENERIPKGLIPGLIIFYLVFFLVAMPLYSKRKSAAFAVPLIVKTESIPVYTYKAPKTYSLSFYLREEVPNIQSREGLKETLESANKAYILVKRSRLSDLDDLGIPLTIKILGTTPKFALILVTRAHPLPEDP